MSDTALLFASSGSPERKPFALQELLYKPIFRYTIDALRKAGWDRLILGLPDAQSGEWQPAIPFFDAVLYRPNCPESLPDSLLLCSDTEISLTPSILHRYREMSHPSMLCDGGRFVAAVVDRITFADWWQSQKSPVKLQLPLFDVRTLCLEEPYIGFAEHTPSALLAVSEQLRVRVLQRLMESGVVFASSYGVVISPDVSIGPDTVILPGTQISGRTTIGSHCRIGPNSILSDSVIEDHCTVESSKLTGAVMRTGSTIGPFSQLRPGSVIGEGVRIGDFVEVKNSLLGAGTHVSHLTYLGDSTVGERVNIGCGVVTCNYDGVHKHRTVIGSDAFIGCNTNLVAPVRVGDRAYTAAGSTVTENVPSDALTIARARQINKENYNPRAEKRV